MYCPHDPSPASSIFEKMPTFHTARLVHFREVLSVTWYRLFRENVFQVQDKSLDATSARHCGGMIEQLNWFAGFVNVNL